MADRKMKNLLQEFSADLTVFVHQSQSVIALMYDSGYRIVAHNQLLSEHMVTPKSLIGQKIDHYLMPESRGILATITVNQEKNIKLLFMVTTTQPLPFECHIFCRSPFSLILGEKLMLTNNAILQKMSALSNDMVNMARELRQKNRELERANVTIRMLQGILPMCSFCKCIRDDKGDWTELEEYMGRATAVEFSHSICPDCMKKHYPE